MKITKNIVDQLDLSAVKKSLMKKGMSLESVNLAEVHYKQFLFMVSKYEGVVPTEFIDIFWHEHILHTRDYAKVCDMLFGTFLNHDSTDEMVQSKDRVEINSEDLLKKEFGIKSTWGVNNVSNMEGLAFENTLIKALCVPAKTIKNALCQPAKTVKKALCVPAKAVKTV